jgi:kynurenine formamidase
MFRLLVEVSMKKPISLFFVVVILILFSCTKNNMPSSGVPLPKEIIDLGALVTEDLPERCWGKRLLADLGWTRGNTFEVLHWQTKSLKGQNSYYTLFNHGGPHVDAPKHIGLQGGLDSYPAESFAGPLKVFDVSHMPLGRTVTRKFIEGKNIRNGDIVMIYTDYQLPATDDDYPKTITLTREASEYLGGIPIRAFATDSWSVGIGRGNPPKRANSDQDVPAPVHHSFLSRDIPIFEALFNVKMLLDKENMYFVGQPLNIEDGDGILVRPFVLVY